MTEPCNKVLKPVQNGTFHIFTLSTLCKWLLGIGISLKQCMIRTLTFNLRVHKSQLAPVLRPTVGKGQTHGYSRFSLTAEMKDNLHS